MLDCMSIDNTKETPLEYDNERQEVHVTLG